MSKTARAGFAVLLLLNVAAPLAAQEGAAEWLEKMAARTAEGHYKFRFNADMTVAEEGMQAAVKVDGTMNFVSPTHFRTAFDVNMDMAGTAVGMAMLTVADGSKFWLEIDSPMLGGKQVMTGSAEQLEELAKMGETDLSGLGGLGRDPIEGIRGLADYFDMAVKSVENDRVTLHADISPEELAEYGDFAGLGNAVNYVTLVLDRKEGLPLRMQMGAAQPFVTIEFADYEFFAAADVNASDYAYTPPEGAQVSDIGAMLGN